MLTTLSIISLDRGKPWREPPAAVEAGADAAPHARPARHAIMLLRRLVAAAGARAPVAPRPWRSARRVG
jgi:hypothetical protein